MTANAFAGALAAMGVDCAVEELGKLAVLIPTGGLVLDAKSRRVIVALGRTHGFANVCFELDPADAALSSG